MSKALRRLLFTLVAIAFVGGTSAQFARPGESRVGAASIPCDRMNPAQTGDAHSQPMISCKAMTADCVKQIGCTVNFALPARFANGEVVAHATSVDYWAAWPKLAGLVREPEPLPPRTI